MSNPQKIISEVSNTLRKNQLRPTDFFRECLKSLKNSACPVVVSEFESDLERIAKLSIGCQSIERLHIQEKFKRSLGVRSDLYFMHLICISDTPLLTLKEGISMELNRLTETVLKVIELKNN